MPNDAELLREYVERQSQAAFAELVRRHIDLVYGAAFRRLDGRQDLAQDVVQKVFIDLARNAEKLRGHTSLVGWLFTGVRFAAAKEARGENRRAHRERLADVTPETGAAADGLWQQIRPEIDEALETLELRDREAVLMRFFENKTFDEIGAALALSGDAVRLRIDRGLDKVREVLARRGIMSTAAILSEALLAHGAVLAPSGLAGAATKTAVSRGNVIRDRSGLQIAISLVFLAGVALVVVIRHSSPAAAHLSHAGEAKLGSAAKAAGQRGTNIRVKPQAADLHLGESTEMSHGSAALFSEIQSAQGNPNYVNLVGHFKRPGTYSFKENSRPTLADALEASEGGDDVANLRRVKVTRRDGSRMKTTELDATQPEVSKAFALQSEDIVYIPEVIR